MNESSPVAARALDIPPRNRPTVYPAPFASRVQGRIKRALGDHFGLRNFGVNLTLLQPGAASALYHRHSAADEFVYLIEGRLLLVADGQETILTPGMCAGFAAAGVAHHLLNPFDAPATYLEIGDRSTGDVATYPNDDLVAAQINNRWIFTHRDGTPYP